MSVKQVYIKDENNEIVSPIVSMDSIYTDGGGSLLDFFYPIGTYYETSDANFNPNTSWGGEWVEDTKGRVLVAWDEEDHQSPTLIGLGEWKGSSTVTLTIDNLPAHSHTGPSHTHTYAKSNASTGSTTLTVNQIPSHTHSAGSVTNGFATHLTALTGSFVVIAKSNQGEAYTYRTPGYTGGGQGHTHTIGTTSTNSGASGTGNTGSTGKNTAFSVVQPSIGVRRWHRIS